MIYLYFYGLALFAGVSTPFWFGTLIIPVRRLRKGAKWLDNAQVNLPKNSNDEPIKVETFRKFDENGDKVVISHFLSKWTDDIQRTIFQTLTLGSLIAAALNVATVVLHGQKRIAGENAGDFLAELASNWPMPTYFLTAVLQILLFFKLIHDQADKYKSLIEKSRPKKKPILIIMIKWVRVVAKIIKHKYRR